MLVLKRRKGAHRDTAPEAGLRAHDTGAGTADQVTFTSGVETARAELAGAVELAQPLWELQAMTCWYVRTMQD